MTKLEAEINSQILHMGGVKVKYGFNIFTPLVTDKIKKQHWRQGLLRPKPCKTSWKTLKIYETRTISCLFAMTNVDFGCDTSAVFIFGVFFEAE
jgi:hypothetical protein